MTTFLFVTESNIPKKKASYRELGPVTKENKKFKA